MLCPHCGKETNDEEFTRKCTDYIVDRFPAILNFAAIQQWKDAGYDFDKHIKPAADEAFKRGVTLTSLNYLTSIITAAAKPIQAPAKQRELTPEEKEKNKAFLRKMGQYVP